LICYIIFFLKKYDIGFFVENSSTKLCSLYIPPTLDELFLLDCPMDIAVYYRW